MFQKIKSNLCLTGDRVEEIAAKYLDKIPEDYKKNRINRDGTKHHVTIHFGNENGKQPDNMDIYPLGLGCDRNKEVYYVVLYYPAGDKVSQQYFHITLGFKENDIHTTKKNIETIQEYETFENIIDFLLKYPSSDPDKLLEIYEHLYHLGLNEQLKKIIIFNLAKLNGKKTNYKKVEELGYQLRELDIVSGSFILTKCFKFVRLNYDNILDNLVSCTELNYTGYMKMDEVNFLLDELNMYQTKKFYYLDANQITHSKLPFNFSHVFDNIYGSGEPTGYDEILKRMNIHHVLTLTEEKNSLTTAHFPIDDMQSPSVEQMVTIIKYIDSITEPILVHCLGGVGRTNTIIICYYMHKNRLNKKEAYDFIKEKRPKMILSQPQINFIKIFNDYLMKNNYLEELHSAL